MKKKRNDFTPTGKTKLFWIKWNENPSHKNFKRDLTKNNIYKKKSLHAWNQIIFSYILDQKLIQYIYYLGTKVMYLFLY